MSAAFPSNSAGKRPSVNRSDADTPASASAGANADDSPTDDDARAGSSDPTTYRTQWLAFWILGTINNFSYVIVQSAAQSLAEQFNAEHLLGLIQWANVGMGTFVRGFNAFYLLHIPYARRVAVNSWMLLLGLGLLSLSVWVNFGLAIVAITIIGSASSFGESVILGYLKDFNPLLMGAWSSGTGMAGVGGTLIYLLLFSVLRLSNQLVFIILAPTAIIYWMAYRVASKSKPIVCCNTTTVAATAAATPSAAACAAAQTARATPAAAPPAPSPSPHATPLPPPPLSLSRVSALHAAAAIECRSSPPLPPATHAPAAPPAPTPLSSPPAAEALSRAASPPPLMSPTSPTPLLPPSVLESSPAKPVSVLAAPIVDGASSSALAVVRAADDGGGGEYQRMLGDSKATAGDTPALLSVDAATSSVGATPSSGGMTAVAVDSSAVAAPVSAVEAELPRARYLRITKAVTNMGGQLALVYFLEYVVSVGFAAKSNPTEKDHPELSLDWWQRNAYPLLSFCYQFGTLISRTSISVLKVRRVWILTALQAGNFALWLIHALHNFIPLWLQFILMIYVGLLGGLMYVNAFYLLSSAHILPPADVELGINIVAIFVNGGIVCAAIFELIASATFLK